MDFVLIGAGGHAKSVWAAIRSQGDGCSGYVDVHPADWLDALQMDDELVQAGSRIAIGLGGVTPDQLDRRLRLMQGYLMRGCEAPTLHHSRALLDRDVVLGVACQIIAGAIVNPGAHLGDGCIVNSGAIVEHDARIGAGAHVAPGAIVLGGAHVGTCSMIGAGAVILPGAVVPEYKLVPSMERLAR